MPENYKSLLEIRPAEYEDIPYIMEMQKKTIFFVFLDFSH